MKDVVIALLSLMVLGLASVAWAEHRTPNGGLPLVQAQAAETAPPALLLSPCPLGPRNLPRVAERKA
jgi:hypothetical protein